jgi:hypothetical protein
VVCQRWPGHRTLSVFLDIYQGVDPAGKARGIEHLKVSLAKADLA